MSAASLEIRNLSSGYGPTRVIENVSFKAEPGSRLAILGRNGVGKTSLFATIAGQTRRYGGEILLNGKNIATLPSAARAIAGLGYVPQTRDVFPTLTVEENLFVGLKTDQRMRSKKPMRCFRVLRNDAAILGRSFPGRTTDAFHRAQHSRATDSAAAR